MWITLRLADGVHVLPLQELSRHELDRGCWCGAWCDQLERTEIFGHTVIGDGLVGRGIGPVQKTFSA